MKRLFWFGAILYIISLFLPFITSNKESIGLICHVICIFRWLYEIGSIEETRTILSGEHGDGLYFAMLEHAKSIITSLSIFLGYLAFPLFLWLRKFSKTTFSLIILGFAAEAKLLWDSSLIYVNKPHYLGSGFYCWLLAMLCILISLCSRFRNKSHIHPEKVLFTENS